MKPQSYLGFSLLLFLVLFFQYCEKEEPLCPDGLQPATIIGQDFRRCACCGGFFIDLGTDTVRALAFPPTFTIDPLPEQPLAVCLSYEELTGPCQDFEFLVEVDRIRYR